MKSLKSVFTLTFVFIALSAYAQPTWQTQYPPNPDMVPIYSCYFVPGTGTGYAGGIGKLLKTTDDGLTWVYQSYSSLVDTIYFLAFTNANTGYAVSNKSGNISRTTNGGTSWIARTAIGQTVNSFQALGYDTLYANSSNYLYKTVNGGQSWSQSTPGGASTFAYGQISFNNYNTGFISSEKIVYDGGYVIRTTNAGNMWFTTSISFPNFHPNPISFLNASTGFISGIYNTYYTMTVRTTNAGNTWDSVSNYNNINYVLSPVQSMKFLDANTGYLIGNFTGIRNKASIFKTSNGGVNWNLTAPFIGANMFVIQNSNTLYIANASGIVAKTTNGGTNWNQSLGSGNYDLKSTFFVDQNNGFAAGKSGEILRTSNGGLLWFLSKYDPYTNFTNVYFTDVNTGWALGNINQDTSTFNLYKTTNSGLYWSAVSYVPSVSEGNKMLFLDTNTGFVALSSYINRGMFRTTDGGNTWSSVFGPGIGSSFSFINQTTGFAAANGLFKTTDGGMNWNFAANFYDDDIICFANETTGWGVYYSSSLYHIEKTTNAGLNWSDQRTAGRIFQMKFFNPSTGYVLGQDNFGGTIGWQASLIKTTNGGNTWSANRIFFSGLFYGMNFINNNTGWICGDNGFIYKTTNGGSVFIGQTGTQVPANYELKQNYPNPFNPGTVIKFNVRDFRFVSLKIYDVTGREVARLVNEKLSPGQYEVSWDASGYSSGVYFYRLTSGDFNETKRMIYLK